MSGGGRYLALAGNPNSGKTTLFNALTGLRHHVGNYPGVTVERKEGRVPGTDLTLLDLPGTYSLAARSPDEQVARDALLGHYPPAPEGVVVVVDASNLERNLYLVSQVLDLGLPVLVCLNMVDVADRAGLAIDVAALERELGAPVLPTVARKGVGVDALKARLQEPLPEPAPRRYTVPEPLRAEVEKLAARLAESGLVPPRAAFFAALDLLTAPAPTWPPEADIAVSDAVDEAYQRLAAAGDPGTDLVEARYEWIQGVCGRVCRQGEAAPNWSERLDRIATHRVWGFGLFFLLMALMFQAIFSWAGIPSGWIEQGQGWVAEQIAALVPEGDLRGLLVDGVLAGVGGVLVFLPQIMILFVFLGLLEDSGYMARAAFVMDRLMSRVGLHGKSFVPLLSSFACAIPGIMATRTIESPRDRLVTILIAPLMSCSARIPVYTLLIAGFIPAVHLWGFVSVPALVMVSLYLLGLLTALAVAWVLKRTLLRGEPALFLMELPPYKVPAPRTVLLQAWDRSSQFLKRAGTIILAITILLWFAMQYPGRPDQPAPERLRGSLAGRAGHLLEPVIAPFGMDWKVGIGIIGSFAAREVFVSTMAIVYSVEDTDEEEQAVSLRRQMQQEIVPATGAPRFTPLSAVALMVFYVLAMQCVSTMAVVRRETGGWKWPAFQWVYMTVLAWGAATLVYQVGTALNLG